MNKKIKSILSIIIACSICLLLNSCTIIKDIINDNNQNQTTNIENKHIEYDVNITVEDLEQAIEVACEIGKSSTIGIKTSTKGIFGTTAETGSGVIIKKEANTDGTYTYFVVTNRHVLGGTTAPGSLEIYDGATYTKAKYISYDIDYDLALISFVSKKLYNVATVQTSPLKDGQYVIAVGSPYDLEFCYNTVTIGNISAVEREKVEENTKGIKVTCKYIQHCASINSGNSGGGLYDISGNLIGINTWKIVGSSSNEMQNLNFAIPATRIIETFKKYL